MCNASSQHADLSLIGCWLKYWYVGYYSPTQHKMRMNSLRSSSMTASRHSPVVVLSNISCSKRQQPARPYTNNSPVSGVWAFPWLWIVSDVLLSSPAYLTVHGNNLARLRLLITWGQVDWKLLLRGLCGGGLLGEGNSAGARRGIEK